MSNPRDENNEYFKKFLDIIHCEEIDIGEEHLFRNISVLINNRNINKFPVSYGLLGVDPSFGYFELGNRYWISALGIYIIGISNGFWERGIGFVEPWLFNSNHAIELYLKGCILFSVWYHELLENHNPLVPNQRGRNTCYYKEIFQGHDKNDLYKKYEDSMVKIIDRFDESGILSFKEESLYLLPRRLKTQIRWHKRSPGV